MLDSLTANYKLLSKIGEGSFSEVIKVRELETGKLFAAKRLFRDFKSIEEVEEYSELLILRKINYHPFVLHLENSVYEAETFKLTLIFNLMDESLYDNIKDRKRRLSETKCQQYLFMLVQGLEFLHKHGIFHRDIKPENILLNTNKALLKSDPNHAEVAQLGDLGSVAHTNAPFPRSEYISTRWYRAPECLLTSGHYGPKMDVWALGCCFYEMLTLQPLFPGENEIDQLYKIHQIIGSPSREMLHRFKNLNCHIEFPKKLSIDFHKIIPGLSIRGNDILKKMLAYHPDNRPTSEKLLKHIYFDGMIPYTGDRMPYLAKTDSKTTPRSRRSSASRLYSLNGSYGSNTSIRSNAAEYLDGNLVIKRLEAVQCKNNKILERNWNKNRPRDVKREIMSNQNLINENQRKTVSHPTICTKRKK